MTIPIKCPTCQTDIEWSEDNPHRPFCSERCKLIDLGAWAAEDHVIPGSAQEDDIFSEDTSPDH